MSGVEGEHQKQIPTPRAFETRYLRQTLDEVIVPQRRTGHLHIPQNGLPCDSNIDKISYKPIGAYPPGYMDWCKRCIQLWRAGRLTTPPPE